MNRLGFDFHQVAYVTTDYERALKSFADIGVTRFFELRDLPIQTDLNGASGLCNVALAKSGGLELEIIQPLDEGAAIYAEPLPTEGFAIRLHHFAQRCDTKDDYEALLAEYRSSGTPIAMEGTSNGLDYFYADMRQTLGHYIEYIHATDEFWTQVGAMVPDN